MRPSTLPVSACAFFVILAGCKTEEKITTRTCCDQPKIPADVSAFTITADDVEGPSDGQKVTIKAVLAAPVKREALYPVLHTLYRHAMTRAAFEPTSFAAHVYDSEQAARSGGSAVGRVFRNQGDKSPRCENDIPYDFTEQCERAFSASFGRAREDDVDDTCRLQEKKKYKRHDADWNNKPAIKVDAAALAVEVVWPFTEDSKDELKKDVRFNTAMTYWIEIVTSLFNKVGDLKQVTFAGLSADGEVVRITLTRAQYDAGFSALQETISAHAALTFQTLGMGKATDKSAEKEQETFKTKTYKAALDRLPKNQVSLSKKLK